jgi:hypothetical protein
MILIFLKVFKPISSKIETISNQIILFLFNKYKVKSDNQLKFNFVQCI